MGNCLNKGPNFEPQNLTIKPIQSSKRVPTKSILVNRRESNSQMTGGEIGMFRSALVELTSHKATENQPGITYIHSPGFAADQSNFETSLPAKSRAPYELLNLGLKVGDKGPNGREITIIELTSGVYTGESENNLPHGFGHLKSHFNKEEFLGGWREGRRHGNACVVKHPNGDLFVGNFREGKPTSGEGKLYRVDGSITTGYVLNSSLQGKGTHEYSDGALYTGELLNGVPHGVGKLVYPSGNKYVGGFKDGLRDGYGKMVYIDSQTVYQGEWKKGKYEGLGTQITKMWEYRGEYSEGMGHGLGVYWDLSNNTQIWVSEGIHGQSIWTQELEMKEGQVSLLKKLKIQDLMWFLRRYKDDRDTEIRQGKHNSSSVLIPKSSIRGGSLSSTMFARYMPNSPEFNTTVLSLTNF